MADNDTDIGQQNSRNKSRQIPANEMMNQIEILKLTFSNPRYFSPSGKLVSYGLDEDSLLELVV